MIVLPQRSFPAVRSELDRLFRIGRAPAVPQDRWQGKDVKNDPAATTYELRNVVFEVPLSGSNFNGEDLQTWRLECMPNLPWADNHFAERVGGVVLNPGEEWKNWPWSKSADRFRSPDELGPRMAPQDWAYLAGMIDGEGTVYLHDNNKNGTVCICQKDRSVLDNLRDRFKVGIVYEIQGSQVINGKTYDAPRHEWRINRINEMKWILEGCRPYFVVKKEKAADVSARLGDSSSDRFKDVWDQKWPGRFRANYMDRFWPRRLEGGSELRGIEGRYGDLNDLVGLLAREPSTRQAWFPMFHPDETGGVHGGRVMCSLGYQFMVRFGLLHVWYPLRSCDLVRHFADDCYLAVRLLLWVLDRCRERNPAAWKDIRPGTYSMHITSLHLFQNDLYQLKEAA